MGAFQYFNACSQLKADKEPACNVGDLGSTPGLGRSPGEGKGYPLQYSGLKNSMDCTKSMGSQRVGHDWAPFIFTTKIEDNPPPPQFSKYLSRNSTTPLKTNEIINCNQSRMVMMGGGRQGTVTRSAPFQQGQWAEEAMINRHQYSEQMSEQMNGQYLGSNLRPLYPRFLFLKSSVEVGGHMFLEAQFWDWNWGRRTLLLWT